MNWRKVKSRINQLNKLGFPIAYKESNGGLYILQNGRITDGYNISRPKDDSPNFYARVCWDRLLAKFPETTTKRKVQVGQSFIIP